MGVFLGLTFSMKAVLNVGRVYDWLGQKIRLVRLDRTYYPILAFILIIYSQDLLTTNHSRWKSAGSFLN